MNIFLHQLGFKISLKHKDLYQDILVTINIFLFFFMENILRKNNLYNYSVDTTIKK